jgi:hypothetical protein
MGKKRVMIQNVVRPSPDTRRDDSMAGVISNDVLQEILGAYAICDQRPSQAAIRNLAAASGKTEQAVKSDYARLYQLAGGRGEPWTSEASEQ